MRTSFSTWDENQKWGTCSWKNHWEVSSLQKQEKLGTLSTKCLLSSACLSNPQQQLQSIVNNHVRCLVPLFKKCTSEQIFWALSCWLTDFHIKLLLPFKWINTATFQSQEAVQLGSQTFSFGEVSLWFIFHVTFSADDNYTSYTGHLFILLKKKFSCMHKVTPSFIQTKVCWLASHHKNIDLIFISHVQNLREMCKRLRFRKQIRLESGKLWK